MRHSDAVLEAESDLMRPLTLRGCIESRQIGIWLNHQSVGIEQVLLSPYLRAEQTFKIIRETLYLPKKQIVLQELTPSGDPKTVVKYLYTLSKKGVQSVLIISHLPLVGYLVSVLCPKEAPLMFVTSAIACVDLNIHTHLGILKWQVSPSKHGQRQVIFSGLKYIHNPTF